MKPPLDEDIAKPDPGGEIAGVLELMAHSGRIPSHRAIQIYPAWVWATSERICPF